jgi:exodeoxyribonuclease V alpha subunit
VTTTFSRSVPPLVPTGTARAIFLGQTTTDHDEALTRDLRDLLAAHDVADGTLLGAWEVTRWTVDAPVAERRALACLVVALLEAVDSGSTFLPLGAAPSTDGRDALSTSLARLGLPEADRHATRALASNLLTGGAHVAISALFGRPGTRRPFILANEALYPERLWSMEDRLISLLRKRLKTSGTWTLSGVPGEAIAEICGDNGPTPLVGEQLAAIRSALHNPLTVIAGGPGTGKTSIIVALLRVFTRLGVPIDQIALAAPTGRAAQRINESVNVALERLKASASSDTELATRFGGATTVHRLLGIRPAHLEPFGADDPVFHAGWRLPQKVVVIDESSMIDLSLMEHLAAAASDDARLIFLGDADQLPSVEVGAVFRDLCTGAPEVTTRLIRSHRMNPEDPHGAEILRVAKAVNSGTLAGDPVSVCEHAAGLRLMGFERLARGALPELLDRWYGEVLAADTSLGPALDQRHVLDASRHIVDDGGPGTAAVRALLARNGAARILCLTRTAGRTTSADAVNRLLHGRVQGAALAKGTGAWVGNARFLPGEPVIVLRNDRTRDLHNGDLGVVLRVRGSRDDGLAVAFERSDGIIAHPIEELGSEIGLAFALTVHKAQGSEYDRVALILPEVDVPLLSRDVLYTAISRARRGVVVIGDAALFALGSSRMLVRRSGIAASLKTPAK